MPRPSKSSPSPTPASTPGAASTPAGPAIVQPARLGDLLVRYGVLTAEQRDVVLGVQKREGGAFGAIAERLFDVSPSVVERAWSEQVAVLAPSVDASAEEPESGALKMIERRQAWQFRVFPLRITEDGLVICTTQDSLARAIKFTGWRIAMPCQYVLTTPAQLGEALERHYPMSGMTAASLTSARNAA